VKAIKNGFSVTHFVLSDLMYVLRGDAAVPPARLRAKRYFNSALLIIDEVGFRPLDRAEANLFFRLVSARYERGSIVLTSNKHVRDWPAVFADDEILRVVQNHKRTERLYRDEGLGVRRRRRKRLPAGPRVIRPAPARPHERWSIDFVHDRLATGRAIRLLTVVDDFTRECPTLAVDYSLPSERVIVALERAAGVRGLPARLVCDHGSEFSSRRFLSWARYAGSRSTSSGRASRSTTLMWRASTASCATNA
jgi:putative transposase